MRKWDLHVLSRLNSGLKTQIRWTQRLSPVLNLIVLDQKEKMKTTTWKVMNKLQCQWCKRSHNTSSELFLRVCSVLRRWFLHECNTEPNSLLRERKRKTVPNNVVCIKQSQMSDLCLHLLSSLDKLWKTIFYKHFLAPLIFNQWTINFKQISFFFLESASRLVYKVSAWNDVHFSFLL